MMTLNTLILFVLVIYTKSFKEWWEDSKVILKLITKNIGNGFN